MPSRLALLGIVVVAVALGGCGGGGGSPAAKPTASGGVAAKPEDFPKGSGLTFQDLQSKYPAQLSLGIGASVMRQGENRLPFVVLDKGARPVTSAAVALYTLKADGTNVRGPYVARETAFGVQPQFLAKNSTQDAAKSFYVADVEFKGAAPQGVFALVRMDGRLVAASPSPLGAQTSQKPPPDVGEKAIVMHTDTVKTVKSLAKLTTRVPPNTDMLQTDLATVLGKKPVVLVFATPALCQSRVCGPVVDVAEQVRSEVGPKVAFIHQEIYRNNDVKQGLRPQLLEWRLESEPWTFVIDRSGVVSARFEGAVSVPELLAAVQKTL